MAFLQITGVPPNTVMYAIVTNDSGQVYLSGTSTFGAFTTQAAAATTLTETPAGSGRHSAAFLPASPGIYDVVYYEKAGSVPAAGDEAKDAETKTITNGSGNVSITVTVTPTNGASTSQIQPDGEVTVSQNTAGVVALEVNDNNGPVSLAPGPIFKAYRDTFPTSQTLFQTAATVSGNVASIPYTTTNTANSGRLRYELRATNGDVLATGLFTIRAVA